MALEEVERSRRSRGRAGGGSTGEAEGTRLLSGRSSKGYRGFESLPLRKRNVPCLIPRRYSSTTFEPVGFEPNWNRARSAGFQ